ncbi:MAG TPA: O-antigen ligase family protein [Acidisarcina sp.]
MLLTIFVAARWSLAKALLWVYLPILLWVPLYMHVSFHGFFIDCATLAGTALGLMALAGGLRHWRFSVTDVLVVLLAFSSFWADAHHRPMLLGFYALATTICSMVFPYVIGKSLIEQTRSRESVAKLLVISLAIIGFVSLYEFRMTSNPFQLAAEALSHMKSGWGRQRRWIFARVAGPFGHAITAGMMFTIGVLLEIWLIVTKRWRVGASRFSGSQGKLVRNAKIITCLVLLGLFETQSRGPWIGCGLGLIIAWVGFSRDRKRSATIAGVLLAITISTGYVVLNRYTDYETKSVDELKDMTQDQQNAVYRRELLTTYKPVIKKGGIWGWGYPLPPGEELGLDVFALRQPSIDNEYLLMAVVQGYAGATILILLFVTTMLALVKHCLAFRRRVDITFAYVMLGIMVATAFSLTTVFLSPPMMQVLFLLIGWAQSLKPTASDEAPEQQLSVASQYAFEKVYS